MKKTIKSIILSLFLIPCILLASCGTMNVTGKTFTYGNVTVDWGTASDDDKNALFAEFQVENENELLAVLRTRNNRNGRRTTFGTDGKYTTKNENNEILDSGYYQQIETTITLAETEEGLSASDAYTLLANEKGYIVTTILNEDKNIFAKYQYVEQE
ncbi:MAG: hypothetical protein E7354_00665 [Clostridiales bacterium]|nr:hypothetical protein [Clostridiales bacterium]